MFQERTSVSYSGRDKSHASFNASLVSMIILGLSLIFVGVYDVNYVFNFIDFDYKSFVWSNSIFSVLLMLYAFYAIKSKIITEGILYMLASLSSVLITLIELYNDPHVGFLMFFFIVGFFGCTIIFRRRGETALMVTSALFILYTIVANILPYDFAYIYGVIMILCGAMLVFVGSSTIVEIDMGRITRTPPKSMDVSNDVYPEMLENTVGSILLALISFLYVYAVYHGYNVSMSYYVFTTIVSILTIVIAVYGIYHGVIGQTVLMFLLALSKLIFTAFGYMELGSTTHVDLMFVVIFIPLIITFYVKRMYAVSLLTLATAITTVAQTFTGYFFIVEFSMALTNIVAIYIALDMWFATETDVRLKDTPFIRKLVRGDE